MQEKELNQFSEEERVFSDSEEENEYINRVLGPFIGKNISSKKCNIESQCDDDSQQNTNALTGPVTTCLPAKCDAEVQCKLDKDQLNLFDIVNICAEFDPDANIEFYELIILCRKMLSARDLEYREKSPSSASSSGREIRACINHILHRLESSSGSESSFSNHITSKIYASSEAFIPSRQSSSEGLKQVNRMMPSKPSEIKEKKSHSTDNKMKFNTMISRKSSTTQDLLCKTSTTEQVVENNDLDTQNNFAPRPKRARTSFVHLYNDKLISCENEHMEQEVVLPTSPEKTMLQPKMPEILNDENKLPQRMQLRKKVVREIVLPHEVTNDENTSPQQMGSTEMMLPPSNTNGVTLNIGKLPKKITRSLARNWLNPNKTIDCVLGKYFRQKNG